MSLKCCVLTAFVMLTLVCEFAAPDNDTYVAKKRVRRYLNFVETSQVFVRLNTKHNMVVETRIYAQGTGFRVNYVVPKRKIKRRHRIHRRDVYENLANLLMHHGYDGRACVLRTLCDASKIISPESNILLKLFKRVFTIPEGDEQYFPYLLSEKCEELDNHCPMSLLQLSKFTDD